MQNKKNRNIFKGILFIAIVVVSFFSVNISYAAINGQINYQGKLTDDSNVAVADGNYDMIISIYDADSGGNCVWTARGTCGAPTARSVAVLNGIFSIMLGDTSVGDTVLTGLNFNVPYYLGVTVESDPEMAPRKPIGATGYAFNSSMLNGLTSATSGVDAHILATDTSGNVTITGTITGSNLSGINTGDQPLIAGTTAGQMSFWDGANWTYSETSEMFWDDINKRLGIGTATPNHTFDVNGNIGLATSSYLNFGTTSGETGYGLRDNAGTLQFKNSGGTWVNLGSGGTTTFLALTDTPSSYNTGRILFETSSGISDNTNLFWDDINQRLGIGTTTPDANLSISSTSGSQFINLHDSTNDDSVGIYSGSGTPEGTVSAQIGSIYSDNSSGRIYKKSSGDDTNIGWEEFTNTSSTAHMAKMTRDVAQSIPSGIWTKINFDTEEFDTGDIADVSTGRFTIKKAGKYLISASWYSSGNLDTGEMMGVSIVINGNDASVSRNYSANTNGYPTVVVSDSFDLSENDYVEMRIDQNEGASQNTAITAATKPRMSVVQLDDANGGESLFTDSGDATYLTSTTDDLILGSNTNTNAPFYLDVSSNSLRLGSGATTNATLNLYASDGDTGSLSYTTNDSFYFNGGNVGIGTASPSAQLHTTGAVRFESFGAGTLVTDASGNLSVSSDERLKNIDGNFNRGIDELMGINPISFHWKENSGMDMENFYVGFSAQNMQNNIPEAVGIDHRGFLTLSDRPILATVVNSVKGQQTQIMGISENVSDLLSVSRDLILKTDENISTVSEIQDLVSENLGKIINQVDLQNQSLESLQTQTNEHGNKIKSIEDMLAILQNKMDDVQEINNQELILAQIDLNRTDIDYIKMILGLDRSGNPGDIKMGGQLEAQGMVAGAFGVKSTDEKNRTIGTVTIKAGDKSASVETEIVNENSKIFVTPDQPVGIGVGSVKNGEGFEIETNIPTERDLKIDWWIIEEK